eukprot:CAMPEP_0118830370 /NCGR_PEP_ID=MMETSP1162-20130426/26859_1 /TAXON_ID=33656 /ORGANISM="Phaeocystis Sp, Strain CCMP2710" /LENGTH=76 /DNA_ID=CAMNT_0006761679 /DNA_START=427 /DNA_END=653 /DNA_ORIENTATION=-
MALTSSLSLQLLRENTTTLSDLMISSMVRCTSPGVEAEGVACVPPQTAQTSRAHIAAEASSTPEPVRPALPARRLR